jgi:hypothetical protein
MRELDPIEVTTVALEPGRTQTLILGQPHPDTILLSHFEVMKLSPPFNSVELTDLRVEQLSYLITPVPLLRIQQEQGYAGERAEQQPRQQLQHLLGSPPSLHLLQKFKPDRRETRLVVLDIRWKSRQQLVVTFKNSGASVVDKVTIELVLYALDALLPAAN